MTQLFVIHSAYGLATVAAAIDAGLIPTTSELILVAVNSARVPETAPDIATEPSLASLRARFDRVYALADILGAMHPSSWEPEEPDLPMLERLFGLAWHVDPHDVHLFVQSPQVAPAKTLMALFGNAEITIVGDGLMTYSPMRIPLPHTILGRITGVVYTDVVAGVTPLVVSPGAAAIPVPPAAFAAALQETAGEVEPFGGQETVVVLGQYLAALGLVTPAEELELQRRMIERAVRFSPARIIFKPHPAAPPHASDPLAAVAERAGIEFVTYTGPLAAELLAQATHATAVVAGFSTTLPTVAALYGTPIAAVGLTEVLAALKPYENSNRVPAVIVDALTRDETPYAAPAALQELIDAVGYVMQPLNAAHLRKRAERFLARVSEAERARYFDPQRLLALRLPGAPTQTAVQRFLHPAGGIGHIEELKLTAIGGRNRLARTWRVLRGRP